MFILATSGTTLAAIFGGVGTLVLAGVAVYQIRHSRRQTQAMEEQVSAVREGGAAEQAAMHDNIRASVEQSKAVREAARAQVQPIVFAEIIQGTIRDGEEGDDLAEGHIGFPYRLRNEGPGVALNVTHGVEIAGIEETFGDGMELRSIRPGEVVPPDEGMEITRRFAVGFPKEELPENWALASRTYWVRFENVFGEVFETRNPFDPKQSAAFMRMTELSASDQASSPHSMAPIAITAIPSPQVHRRWESHTTVVAITAAAAILGAAVGGVASYLGNNALQKSQDTTAARGAGRVLQADFLNAVTRIQYELANKRFIVPEPQSSALVSEADEKLIASNVSARTWDHIAAAKVIIQDELEALSNPSVEVLTARKHEHVVLQGARLHFEESALRTLYGAVVALKELTGTDSAE